MSKPRCVWCLSKIVFSSATATQWECGSNSYRTNSRIMVDRSDICYSRQLADIQLLVDRAANWRRNSPSSKTLRDILDTYMRFKGE